MKTAILDGQQNNFAAKRADFAKTEVPTYERSLEAMWHACRASKFAALNQIETNAGVVLALLSPEPYIFGPRCVRLRQT